MINQNDITVLIITSAIKSIPEIRKNMHAISKVSEDLNFIEDTLENIKNFSGIEKYIIVHDFKIDSHYSKTHNNNLIKIQKVDLLHCRSYLTTTVGQKIKKKTGIPFIFDQRGFYADERVDGRIWPQEKFLYRKIFKYFKKKKNSSCKNHLRIFV